MLPGHHEDRRECKSTRNTHSLARAAGPLHVAPNVRNTNISDIVADHARCSQAGSELNFSLLKFASIRVIRGRSFEEIAFHSYCTFHVIRWVFHLCAARYFPTPFKVLLSPHSCSSRVSQLKRRRNPSHGLRVTSTRARRPIRKSRSPPRSHAN